MFNYVVSKLSLVIGSTRLDTVDLNRLPHVVLLICQAGDLRTYDHRDY